MTLKKTAVRLERKIRTVSFDGNVTDPYIIGHQDTDQLADKVLKARWIEYQNVRQAFDEEE